MIKVIFIQDIGDIGGATKCFKQMVLELYQKYNVYPIIITSDFNSVNEFANAHNFENYSIGHRQILVASDNVFSRKLKLRLLRPYYNLKHLHYNHEAVKALSKAIDFSKVDLIHTNVNRNDFGLILSKKYNIPHVMHLRETNDNYGCVPLSLNYIHYFNKYTNKFIAISNNVKNYWIKKGIKKDKIVTIYDGVEENKNLKSHKKNKTIKIIIAGYLTETKGQDQAIKAIKILNKNNDKKIQLDIYGMGEPEYLAKLKKYVKDNNLNNSVNFCGYVKDVYKEMYKYDIGLMCSKNEGFGLVTVEYMLNKVAVVASNTGANKEIISNGENGLIYEYNNVNDLANKIKYLCSNLDKRTKYINNAYDFALNNYSASANAKNVYNLYLTLLGLRRKETFFHKIRRKLIPFKVRYFIKHKILGE